jgi:hypothetical protein
MTNLEPAINEYFKLLTTDLSLETKFTILIDILKLEQTEIRELKLKLGD